MPWGIQHRIGTKVILRWQSPSWSHRSARVSISLALAGPPPERSKGFRSYNDNSRIFSRSVLTFESELGVWPRIYCARYDQAAPDSGYLFLHFFSSLKIFSRGLFFCNSNILQGELQKIHFEWVVLVKHRSQDAWERKKTFLMSRKLCLVFLFPEPSNSFCSRLLRWRFLFPKWKLSGSGVFWIKTFGLPLLILRCFWIIKGWYQAVLWYINSEQCGVDKAVDVHWGCISCLLIPNKLPQS